MLGVDILCCFYNYLYTTLCHPPPSYSTFGAIPALVAQLRRPETRVQIAVLGALRNLSFGRANDENKMEIAGEHGLAEILLALKMSRVVEVRDLLTSLLWNLSSCEVRREYLCCLGQLHVTSWQL